MPVQPIQYATAPASGPMGTPSTASKGASSQVDNGTGMGSDAFLKLLVAQMKYQDPSNPADSTQMLAQTAQYTVVEKLSELSKMDQKVLDASKAQSAAALLGRTVTWKDVAGKAHTGVVSATSWGASTPNLTIGDSTVSIDDVTSVSAT